MPDRSAPLTVHRSARIAADRSAAKRAWLALALLASLWGCGGPGRVEYDGGRCLRNGQAMTSHEVETEQAEVAQRIASRQPWFAVITIGVVVVAAAGNIERALLLFRARQTGVHRPLAERIRDMLVRQRDNPGLYVTLFGASLALIVIGGASYVYLDIDKRSSERALAMLQFCHLALRTQEEQVVLDEQRKNLQAIESTAGDIRTLVDKLPPDQQRKAQLIVTQMNDALAKQGKIVGDYAARTDEAQKDLSAHTQAMEKGLASVKGDLDGLRSLPTNFKDLASATHRIDQATASIDDRFDELRVKMDGVSAKVDGLLARPACEAAASPKPAASSSVRIASPEPPPPEPARAASPANAPAHPAAESDAGAMHAHNP